MAVRLVSLDATNTCIKVAKSVGYLYARAAKEYGLTLEVAQLDKAFRTAYKHTYTTLPNFGCYHDISCKQWWKEYYMDNPSPSFYQSQLEDNFPSSFERKISWENHASFPLVPFQVVVSTLTTVGVSDRDTMEKISERLYTDFAGPDYWEVFPDVHPSLQQLKAAGVTLGIISNFDDRLRTILDHLDLEKYFDFILTSYEVKHAKPGPRIFQLALEKARTKEAIHVGDSYELDYAAARQVGMKSLMLIRNGTERSKDLPKDTEIIGSLSDVLQYC